jgi:hypothetical protein
MTPRRTDLKHEIEKSLGLLRTSRDEIRVQLHLGGVDAKVEWRKAELELAEVERAANKFTEETLAAVSGLVKRLARLRSSLGKG